MMHWGCAIEPLCLPCQQSLFSEGPAKFLKLLLLGDTPCRLARDLPLLMQEESRAYRAKAETNGNGKPSLPDCHVVSSYAFTPRRIASWGANCAAALTPKEFDGAVVDLTPRASASQQSLTDKAAGSGNGLVFTQLLVQRLKQQKPLLQVLGMSLHCSRFRGPRLFPLFLFEAVLAEKAVKASAIGTLGIEHDAVSALFRGSTGLNGERLCHESRFVPGTGWNWAQRSPLVLVRH